MSSATTVDDLISAIGQVLGFANRDGRERRLVTRTTLAGQDQMRILVVEDNLVNQHVAKAILQKRGHFVDIVENGQLAVEAVLSKPYDLVLMDIQMPVMDGHEATRRIRERERFASLPIVALTAHAFAEERERCEASGMDDFLAKPMKPAELFDILKRWGPDGARTARSTREPPVEEAAGIDSNAPPVDVDSFRAIMREGGIEEIVQPTLELYERETS